MTYVTHTVAPSDSGADVRFAATAISEGEATLVREGRDLNFISGNLRIRQADLRASGGVLVTLPDTWTAGPAKAGGGLMEASIIRAGEAIGQGLLSIYIASTPDASVSGYFNQPIFTPAGEVVVLADDDVILVYLNTGTGVQLNVDP